MLAEVRHQTYSKNLKSLNNALQSLYKTCQPPKMIVPERELQTPTNVLTPGVKRNLRYHLPTNAPNKHFQLKEHRSSIAITDHISYASLNEEDLRKCEVHTGQPVLQSKTFCSE